MQSMFRLPWSTESPGDKIMERATLHKQRPMAVAELPHLITKIKRKKTDSPEPAAAQHAHVVKKWKGALGEVRPVVLATPPSSASSPLPQPSLFANFAGQVNFEPTKVADSPKPVLVELDQAQRSAQPSGIQELTQAAPAKQLPPATQLEAEPRTQSSMATDVRLTDVQQAIEAQINYEILLKHNELRLIEQELAKCQVSLEQLRRCSLIPFPGTEGLSEQLSLGTGHALSTPAGFTEPKYAAPWGVTDGPYTRHYAKWLISDAKFDSVSQRALAQQSHGYFGNGEGRATRGSFADFGSANRGRTSRTSTGMLKLAPLGESPAPAPKIDPLLHKRSTDGQWVRLYCAQCAHSNFSNTQGFLNHCRIKHNQVFKSHDQAAIACGVPVDVNEIGNPVTATDPVSTHATAPVVPFPVQAMPGIVHPLATVPSPAPQAKSVYRDPTTSLRKEPGSADATDFTMSATPYLMAQAQNSGFHGDLGVLIDTMRSKVDVDMTESLDEETTEILEITASPPTSQPLPARLPTTTSHSVPANKSSSTRPSSTPSKMSTHIHLPLSLPSLTQSGNEDHVMSASPLDLSPNTVDSNPGLVSDHDDDDDDDAYDTRSHSDLVMHDHHIVVQDASDGEGVHEPARSQQDLNNCFESGEGSGKN